MPFEIHKSQFWDGADQNAFENAVQNYIRTLHDFNRVVGKPRPTAHPLVERAIRRIQKEGHPDQFFADYVVIDDTPQVSLEEKKSRLISKLRNLENATLHAEYPRGKMRLALHKCNQALLIKEDQRTEAQLEDIALVKRIQDFTEGVQEIAVHLEAEIEDLTEQNIDSWQMPELNHG